MRATRPVVILLLLPLLVFGALLVGPQAHAAAPGSVDDFTFDSLVVDYRIDRTETGTSILDVSETFVARFPDTDQNHGMRRAIPTKYNGQPLNPQLVSITDAQGAQWPTEEDYDNGEFQMTARSDEFLHGPQTFVFHYRLENVTWDFPDTGPEFYWNVNGVDWLQPFGEVTARLHVPAELASELTGSSSCYQGPTGSTDSCGDLTTSADGTGTVVTASATNLSPRENLTLAVGFADNTFAAFDSSPFANVNGWVQSVAGAVLAAITAGSLWIRRRFVRNEPGTGIVIAQFAPPDQLDLPQHAWLVGAATKTFPAAILQLAVRGAITIADKNGDGKKLGASIADRRRAPAWSKQLLKAMNLTTGSQVYWFSKRSTRVGNAAKKVQDKAYGALKSNDYFREVPKIARMFPIVAAGVGFVVVIMAGAFALDEAVALALPLTLFIVGLVLMLTTILLVSGRPLTRKGSTAKEHLDGLKLFISWAEADRIRMLQSPEGAERISIDTNDPQALLKLYEPLLPYAVLFGQEKSWGQVLQVLHSNAGTQSPGWYSGTNAISISALSSSLGSLSTSTSSSSSGGSSGGGSSGGGGGGGGGGGV